MGTKERREREKDQTRTAILDAARELFVSLGYEGVSMRAIAEKIEYSPTVIYNYFRDKEALISELCQSDFGRLAEQLHETAASPTPSSGSASAAANTSASLSPTPTTTGSCS
jgi:AcrR family transcriptional regulator